MLAICKRTFFKEFVIFKKGIKYTYIESILNNNKFYEIYTSIDKYECMSKKNFERYFIPIEKYREEKIKKLINE